MKSHYRKEKTKISSVPNIIQEDIEFAIETQKGNKASGTDGISSEVLKLANHTTSILKEIFKDIINTETIPQQWAEFNLNLLHKKGDQCDIGGCQHISLMSNMYKMFEKIILKQMEENLDDQQPIEQVDLRKYYLILNHIYAEYHSDII